MSGMQPTYDEQQIEEMFGVFDSNSDKKITTDEFGMVLRALNFNPTDKEIADFIKKLDTDNSGFLELDEFIKFFKEYKGKHQNDEKAIRNAFKAFDKNGNGMIEASELRAIMQRCGQTLSDSEIEEMIKVADSNHDGKINYNEFVEFICKPVK
ncbi:neo-calmodulin-like [Mya arenaria]|uniref:neo-calmodulin-like n=1 Tax=Mya arenaria TaxID=6604 RepID=UPI0022E4C565|nr:neo-calmodulin-like [Mya arenaria]